MIEVNLREFLLSAAGTAVGVVGVATYIFHGYPGFGAAVHLVGIAFAWFLVLFGHHMAPRNRNEPRLLGARIIGWYFAIGQLFLLISSNAIQGRVH